MSQTTRLDGAKLVKVAKRIFQDEYFDVGYNDYSSICGMIMVTGDRLLMHKLLDLDKYGFKVTLVRREEYGFVIYVYQKDGITIE